MATKSRNSIQEGEAPNPCDFPLGTLSSRAAARALAQAKIANKNVIEITNYAWEPDHPSNLISTWIDEEGQSCETWEVAYSPPIIRT